MLREYIEKYWFLAGLITISVITLADSTETVANIGKWLKNNHGPDAVIFFIFFFSGFILNISDIKKGLKDTQVTVIVLLIIFIIAPIIGAIFGLAPLPTGIKIGIFLVAVMPTTLSSGVVMTGVAGGNMAHALVITLMANTLSVITIPITLSILLHLVSDSAMIALDKATIMLKISMVVIAPLCMGLLVKQFGSKMIKSLANRHVHEFQNINQLLVLCIVWMALSGARDAIMGSGRLFGISFLTVFLFHGFLLLMCGLMIKYFKIGHGRMESVIFMGGQKTLPLSVILQVTLFPQYGIALVVCVLHHVVHLLMDGYLLGKLQKKL